jgi:hypothetical protein
MPRCMTEFYQTILDEGPEIGTLLLRFQDNARRAGVDSDLLPYIGNPARTLPT